MYFIKLPNGLLQENGAISGPEAIFCMLYTTIASFLGKKIKFQITRIADISKKTQISVPEPGEKKNSGIFFRKISKRCANKKWSLGDIDQLSSGKVCCKMLCFAEIGC